MNVPDYATRQFNLNNRLRMKIPLIIAVAVGIVVSASSQTNPADSNAWRYDTPMSALPRPAWLDRVMMFCMPFETPYETAPTYRLKPWAKELQRAGFTLMGMYPDSFCRLYGPEPGDTWPESCRSEVRRMHALKMKVLAGVYPHVGERGPRDLLTEHPEWRLRDTDAVPDAPGNGCLVNPGFRRALIALLVQRIREFDVDGYQFDGWYQFGYCCCPGCRETYRAETGLEIPAGGRNLADPDYRKYLLWRDHKLLESFLELRQAVKAAKPDFIVVEWNNNDCYGSVPSGMPEALDCVADWINKEWWDSFDVESIWLNKRLRGASGDERPPGIQPYMFMRWWKDIQSGVYHGSSAPMTEILYRTHEVMAMGSVPIIWSGARVGWQPRDWDATVNAIKDFLPWVQQTRSLNYAVCIDSYTSLQNCRAAAGKRIQATADLTPEGVLTGSPRAGIARALLEEHIPFDVISEHNVNAGTLAQYKVVILPNDFCMSDRLTDVIRNYAMNGGGVVATYETSLFDEAGKRRDNFGLADIFKANYVSDVSEGPSRIGFAADAHVITADDNLHDWMGKDGRNTYWGRFARVRAGEGAAMPIDGEHVLDEKNAAAAKWAPLLASTPGRGRCAYFPAAIDAAYYNDGYPYERRLIANAVRWAAGCPAPVKIHAPMCVLAGFFVRDDARRRQTIVHLLNGIDSTTGHGSKQEKQFAIREEVVPIHDVHVTFDGKRPSRVFLVPGDASLKVRRAGPGWTVTVPQLDVHAVVVAEYDGGRGDVLTNVGSFHTSKSGSSSN